MKVKGIGNKLDDVVAPNGSRYMSNIVVEICQRLNKKSHNYHQMLKYDLYI